ncbi:F0F1 ATP synthase subunit A [Chloroflexus aggregans]|uniref:ATP synthase subunit a n=1 Tax=Chloroflexus aggregans (strain MD-66 / DSM 9485) TaxID=326427 RepID=B8G6H2_CHLAD|nr:F0F1 ATP synthase subunit A [Chloroflexus aggregans]ACL23909.1 ATP synthase F0, A subunit [Chloroflexus aggregans DSM 9485]
MSTRTRTILIIVGALVISIVSRFFLYTGPPHVEVAAEVIFDGIPGFPITNSFIVTIIVDILLIAIAFAATRNLQMVPRGLQNVMEFALDALYNLFRNINAKYVATAFPLVTTIFLFVLLGNWFGLLPGVGSIGVCHEKKDMHGVVDQRLALTGPASVLAAESEEVHDTCAAQGKKLVPLFRAPAADLNFTFAIAAISFVFIEYWGFRALGPGYLKKFFNLNGIMSFVGIIEFISELVKPFALAFRLFGNIFAGEVLLVVMAFLLPLLLPLPFYGFEVFVGFIQAVIFALLTYAFLNIAVTGHDEEHAH